MRHYVTVITEFAGQQVDEFLARAYPDPKQRAHAVRWLGWVDDHADADEVIEWWAIPLWGRPSGH
jgi:hypothetical protein